MTKKVILGFIAGIISGMAYGLNPLFAKPLLSAGMSVISMLFFRYLIAVIIIASYILIKKHSFKINLKQSIWLIVLGLLYTGSSGFLFEAYNHIPSGLATTLIYLYPIFTALIMVFLRQYPTWQVWVSIVFTAIGVLILCKPSNSILLNGIGITLSILSGLCFSLYLIVVNKAKALKNVSSNLITFYALSFGTILFLFYHSLQGGDFFKGLNAIHSWINLFGLALIPTVLSLVTLSIASKSIGPTKTSVLGIFEPITAIIIGYALLGEPLTWNISIGVIICILAILFMILTHKEKITPNIVTTIKIRPALKEDCDIVCWTVLHAIDINPKKNDLDNVKILCNNSNSLYYWGLCNICEINNKAVGCIISYPSSDYLIRRKFTFKYLYEKMGLDFRNYPLETEDNEYYIDSMAIKSEYRGMGIGKHLIKSCIDRAIILNLNKISLLCDTNKSGLIHYYEDMGFEKRNRIEIFSGQFYRMIKKI